jgi:hypothetical protein
LKRIRRQKKIYFVFLVALLLLLTEVDRKILPFVLGFVDGEKEREKNEAHRRDMFLNARN